METIKDYVYRLNSHTTGKLNENICREVYSASLSHP
jgi:hypothetical protein